MSITFWCPDAPSKEVEGACSACDGSGKFYSDTDCPYCHGSGREFSQVSELPEINMSNANADAFMKALRLPEDYCGTIVPSQMEELENRARLLAVGVTTPALEVETVEVSANYIICGRSNEYVRRRAAEFVELFSKARAAGHDISWG